MGALYLLACSIPFVLVSAGIRGVIEAHRRFDLTNLVRATAGMAAFAAPLWMLSYTHDLTLIAAALLACRVLELVANALIFRIAVPGLGWPDLPRREQLRRLLDYGGWLTVTNVVGPLMTYLDRFLVGGLLTISAVTYYATPYDVISKQGIVPASLLGVVFPELCVRASGDAAGFIALYEKSLVCLMAIMAVPAIFLVIFAEPLLHGWLGAEFARQSSVVVKLLAIGMFLNGVAQAPFAAIQALGRPDLTAKLHLLELPLYLGLLWLLVLQFGITGAALAWLFRALSDTTLLMWLCHRLQPAEVSRVVMFSIVLVGTGVLLAVLAGLSSVIVTGTVSRFIMFAVCTILIVAVLRLYFAGPVGALTTDGSQPEKVISYV
jgi:O-antigen/teichoic acid export membrane protein